MAISLESWKPFLPPHATVMARRPVGTLSQLESAPRLAPRVLFIGSAADTEGEGLALLHKMVGAMGLKLDEVLILASHSDLTAQVQAASPEVLVTLGEEAWTALTVGHEPWSAARGRFSVHSGVPLMPTLSPSLLLKQPAAKREVWADLQQVMKRLGVQA